MSNNDVRNTCKSYWDSHPRDVPNLRYFAGLLADAIDGTTRREVRGHLTASAVVFNPAGRALLVHHRKVGTWIQPGGNPEPEDNTLVDTATRELEEETGISAEAVTVVTPEPIQVHAHTTPVRYTTRGPAHYHFDFRFVLRTSADVGPLRAAEVGGADWLTPDRLPDDVLRSRVLNLALA